jgi:hypothetical protein
LDAFQENELNLQNDGDYDAQVDLVQEMVLGKYLILIQTEMMAEVKQRPEKSERKPKEDEVRTKKQKS